MPGTQELTRRIKSVKSTRKVTRAMQMVSASKMRKSQSQALASRSYAELASGLIASLKSPQELDIPLLKQFPDAQKIGVVVISTNKGLVGSFNVNLLLQLKDLESQWLSSKNGRSVDVIVVGKKVSEAATRMRKQVIADFPKSDGGEQVTGVYAIAAQIVHMYESGEYANIYIVYNHFVSTLTQKAVVKQLLPFSEGTGYRVQGTEVQLASATKRAMDSGLTPKPYTLNPVEYTFEPSPELVINHLVPRILESQLYQALLESDASEHSSRMIMMKNATDSAGDLIADLTLTFNQMRQNKITTELSEITAGKIALEGQ